MFLFRFFKFSISQLVVISVFSSVLQAAEPTPATQPLYRQTQILREIQPYVERIDLARLFVIQTSIQTAIGNMESNVAAGKNEITMETMRLLQNLIVQYRFSQVFFGWQEPKPITSISTPITEPLLVELYQLSEKLVDDYGFDDSPYTQITTQTFNQMHKLLQQLETLPMDEQLRAKLRQLWAPIGETVALAVQGDRPNTFKKAILTIEQLRTLYPDFNTIASSSAGFPLIMELQGLAEFYAEFAQMP